MLNSMKMASNQGVDIAQLPIPQLSQLSQQLEQVIIAVLFFLDPKVQPLEQLMAKEKSILCEIHLNLGKVPFITHTNQVETWVSCVCARNYPGTWTG